MLATLDDLEAYLALAPGNADEALLGDLLVRASGIVEQICNRHLALASYSETRNGNGSAYLPLREGPVVAITSLTVAGDTFDPSRYAFDDNGIYLRDTIFPRGPQCVSIAYQAGFATIPGEVVHTVVEIAALMYRGKDRLGETSRTIGGGTTVFSTEMVPAGLHDILNNYRRVV